MPRDDGYDPKKNFNPQIQEQLNKEQIEELIETAAKKAVAQVFKEHGLGNPYEQPAVDPNAPRAYTSEEVTEQVMEQICHDIHYWQTQPNCGSMENRVEGVIHSTLAMLDGCKLRLPAFDLVPDVHEDDKDYHIENGENYYDSKSVASTSLHELLYPTLRKLYPEKIPPLGRTELNPKEMRETFTQAAYDIAWKTALHVPDKREACEGTAYQIMQLLDGEHPDYADTPPFMVFAAPTEEFNRAQQLSGNPTWDSSIPLNRKPPYGATDSLVDTYETIRNRDKQAKRDLFK
jgi:hypothetical protein